MKRFGFWFILLLAACGGPAPPAPVGPQPVEQVPQSNYYFVFEDLLEPKVLQLRREEKLDDLLQGVSSEKEIFERLTLWARRQFEPGFPDPYPLSNGIDILKDIRSGKTKGFCGQYSYLLADALKSLGFFDVRYVEIGSDLQHTHFLVEAWSNRLNRWMLLDPLYAAVVEDTNGVPQSAWEVHSALIAKNTGNLRRRWLAPEKEVPRGPDGDYFAFYARTAVSLRNDLARMDHPWTIRERLRDFLQIAGNASSLPNEYENISNRAADFTSPRNVCDLALSSESKGTRVHLSNAGTCVYFDGFEIRLDEGDWKRAPSDFLVQDPFTKISCRAMNKAGIKGHATTKTLNPTKVTNK